MFETFKDQRTELRRRDTMLEKIKDLRTELRIRDTEMETFMEARFEAMLQSLTASQEKLTTTLYFTRLQIIETQVPAVEQRVLNVEKVRRDEEKGQVTHLRVDVLDNSFGQLDKRVVILMRDVDSSFRNELEKMKDNEASIAPHKNKKLTANDVLGTEAENFHDGPSNLARRNAAANSNILRGEE